MLLFAGILISLCALAIFIAGLLAFIRNNEKHENRWFLGLSVVLSAWVVINYLSSNVALSADIGQLLVKFDFALALVIGWALLQFVIHLTLGTSKNASRFITLTSPKAMFLSVLVIIIAAGLLVTDLIFTTSTKNGFPSVDPGPLFFIYVAAIVSYFVLSFYVLLSNYFRGSRSLRRRLSLIILGFAVATVANIMTNLLFPNIIEQRATIQALNTLGYVGIFLLALCIGWAITTRKLFDIKLVIVRSVIYLVLIGIVGLFYSAASILMSLVLSGEREVDWTAIMTSLAVTLFVAMTFQYLKKRIDKTTNRLFFQFAYEPQQVLDQLSRETSSSTDLDRIMIRSKRILEDTLQSSYCGFILIGANSKVTHVAGDLTLDHKSLQRLVALMPRTHKPIVTELLNDTDERHILLASLGAELVFPLYTTEGVFGILVLGTKQNGMDYVQGDIQLLTIATSNLSVALQNALRFEEIERFNETLQQKVNDATRQLQQSNKKLKQLNESKDDFIGMASHQLRTPLTSIKGYVSLVMDGDAGKVTATQRQLLQQAFSSSQKMVNLIADLLNVSRLKTGKFSIERVPTNLAKLISDEISQLREEAKGRGVELEYHAPANFPVLPLDETKTRQVIMNFLDNAIYYTPSGGHIRVELKELPKSVEFRAIDDGIGVPKHERHHLFTKFYRAKNAQRTRPDGTGLGLYMAQKVVMAQGGSIIFNSEEGKGSTFGFAFPKDMPLEQVPLTAETRE